MLPHLLCNCPDVPHRDGNEEDALQGHDEEVHAVHQVRVDNSDLKGIERGDTEREIVGRLERPGAGNTVSI